MTTNKWKRTKGQEFAPLTKLEPEGKSVEGYFRGIRVGSTKGGKEFRIIDLDSMPSLQSVSLAVSGHLGWLIDQANLVDGDLIRITFIGWDTMDDGNKARQYLLEKAEQDA